MLRSDIVKIVNTLSMDYATKSRSINGVSSLDFDLSNCYDAILNYCKENKTRPTKNTYKQENGLLYINNNPVYRVGLMYNKPNYEALKNNGVDYENKILAIQESIYD